MAITNRTTVAEPVGTYYEKRFLMRSEFNFVFMQLGQKGTVPKNQGQTVVWNRFTNPTSKTSALTEGRLFAFFKSLLNNMGTLRFAY